MAAAEFNSTQLQALLDRGAEGAVSAYDLLLSQASDRLLRLTRKMFRAYPHLQRWEQTDDVFQTAALRLHRSLTEVRPPTVAAFWGLATTQIRRTLIDLARHHFGPEGSAANHESQGDSDNSTHGPARGVNRVAAGQNGPESVAEWAEFHQLIDELPDGEREIFHLVWYAGMPQKDIAELLYISLPTVQRRWYAAQLHLFELSQGNRPPLDGERA
jgi:RNA polymerase sigma-70 factor (ECF subfamily)